MNRFTEHITANTTATTKTRGHTSRTWTETDAIAKKINGATMGTHRK